MSRRKWLWFSLAGIPLIAAGALAASTFTGKSTSPTSQGPPVESTTAEECCARPECCQDCPPDCPPEACPLCEK